MVYLFGTLVERYKKPFTVVAMFSRERLNGYWTWTNDWPPRIDLTDTPRMAGGRITSPTHRPTDRLADTDFGLERVILYFIYFEITKFRMSWWTRWWAMFWGWCRDNDHVWDICKTVRWTISFNDLDNHLISPPTWSFRLIFYHIQFAFFVDRQHLQLFYNHTK